MYLDRVKLAVNRATQEAVAVKILSLEKAQGAIENVRKEVGRQASDVIDLPWSLFELTVQTLCGNCTENLLSVGNSAANLQTECCTGDSG